MHVLIPLMWQETNKEKVASCLGGLHLKLLKVLILRGSLRFLPSTSHRRQQWRPRIQIAPLPTSYSWHTTCPWKGCSHVNVLTECVHAVFPRTTMIFPLFPGLSTHRVFGDHLTDATPILCMAQQRKMSYRTFIEDFPSFCITDATTLWKHTHGREICLDGWPHRRPCKQWGWVALYIILWAFHLPFVLM